MPEDADGRVAFLEAARRELGLGGRVVVVSPSKSGQFSVPLLLRQPDWLAGYVPVAPVMTELITPDAAANIKVRPPSFFSWSWMCVVYANSQTYVKQTFSLEMHLTITTLLARK